MLGCFINQSMRVYMKILNKLSDLPNIIVTKLKGLSNFGKPQTISETSKCRESLSRFCIGDGLDIGYGGDPIVASAICMDMPLAYAKYINNPQHLHGDAKSLHWFRDNCLDFIYSSHVLEDFLDTESVINEWLRVLKIDGMLVLYLPDEQTYRRHCQKNNKSPNIHHIHENFSLDFIKTILFKRNDVKIIHEKFPVGIYSFELVVKKVV